MKRFYRIRTHEIFVRKPPCTKYTKIKSIRNILDLQFLTFCSLCVGDIPVSHWVNLLSFQNPLSTPFYRFKYRWIFISRSCQPSPHNSFPFCHFFRFASSWESCCSFRSSASRAKGLWSRALLSLRRVFLDKCREAKCCGKTLEKSGLEPTAPILWFVKRKW